MIEKILFISAVITAIHGNAVAPATRDGRRNEYYLFTSAVEDLRIVGRDQLLPIGSSVAFDITTEIPTNTQIPNLIADEYTVVIAHGHNGDRKERLNSAIINALLHSTRPGTENIIVLDWSSYSRLSYAAASAAVPSVGRELGLYLAALADRNLINLDKLHLVGFNLGAHVVGFAGRTLNGLAARITGLDPSGSRWGSQSGRLYKDDAKYVEVIHTDGDGLLSNGLGTPIGDADFFINGGNNQPGCLTHACSHNRAWELFADTLTREEPLQGNLCTSNLQLTLNRCSTLSRLHVGGDDLSKTPADIWGVNMYRVNIGR